MLSYIFATTLLIVSTQAVNLQGMQGDSFDPNDECNQPPFYGENCTHNEHPMGRVVHYDHGEHCGGFMMPPC